MSDSTKADYRRQLAKQRQSMSGDEVDTQSRQILSLVIETIPWDTITSLHTYVSMPLRHEVDTAELLEYAWEHQPHVMTAVPVMHEAEMRAQAVGSQATWRRTLQGLPEPDSGELLPPEQQFDVIVVPMLGFNEQGYRIGYGGGFYDRFLASQPQALKIGLCYGGGAVDFAPEPHDVSLNYIVCENQVHKFT